MGEVFITRKGGGGKAAAPTIAITNVGGTWIELEITNNDAAPSGATIFVLANYDPTSETDFDLQASQNGFVFAVAEGATVTQLVTGLDPDTSHTVSAQAAVIKKLLSSVVTTDTINLTGTGVTAPTVGPITENIFTSITFNVRNDDTVVPQIIKANITESTTVPTVYPFESSTLAALATGSITVSDLTSGTVYYIHARAFDGEFSSSNVVFGPYTQSSPIVATGGTITNYTLDEVDYRVHTFTGNGTFAVTSVPNLTGFNELEYLVVAGGGGGGNQHSGGAGAGGYRTTNGTSGRNSASEPKPIVQVANYTITVGSGGAGTPGSVQGAYGSRGNPSSLVGTGINVTTIGGGGGGAWSTPVGIDRASGGSGGGGQCDNSAGNVRPGGLGTAGEGFDGAAGTISTNPYLGPGGGGAGANGGQRNANIIAGAGGVGLSNILRTGFPVFYAGGGGGGVYWISGSQPLVGPGGNGGGGAGGFSSSGSSSVGGAGAANTGGGGGASGTYASAGGAGGSGIVIIRYVVGGTV